MNQQIKPKLVKKNTLPLKVLQFGEGNFLRAFVGHTLHKLNEIEGIEMGIAVVQPIEKGMLEVLENQGGAYTLFLNGLVQGKEIQENFLIQNIVSTHNPYTDFEDYLQLAKQPELEFIISNTTEAGIAFESTDQITDRPPKTFPAKLTRLLWERFLHFKGTASCGLHFLPCELINYNADTLKKCILQYIDLWNLDQAFTQWIEEENHFHNTLVDRIVPGYPKDNTAAYQAQLAYEDQLMVTAEPFYLWVIEGDEQLTKKFPVNQIDLNVQVVSDMQPFRTRKVRILNGSHTALVPLSLLYGHQTVSDIFTDPFTDHFLRHCVLDEIVPTLAMDAAELNAFATAVFDRFKNPFIKHYLSSIALNSISKFKVRVLPSLLAYQEIHHRLPNHLTFSMACLLRFYKGTWKGQKMPIQDDPEVVSFIVNAWKQDTPSQTIQTLLQNESFWGSDLSTNSPLATQLEEALKQIEKQPLDKAFSNFTTNFQ